MLFLTSVFLSNEYFFRSPINISLETYTWMMISGRKKIYILIFISFFTYEWKKWRKIIWFPVLIIFFHCRHENKVKRRIFLFSLFQSSTKIKPKGFLQLRFSLFLLCFILLSYVLKQITNKNRAPTFSLDFLSFLYREVRNGKSPRNAKKFLELVELLHHV